MQSREGQDENDTFWDFDGTLAEAPHIWSNTLHRLLLEAAPDCGVTLAAIRQYTARIFPWDTPDDDHTKAVYDAWWRYMEAQFLMTYRALGVTEDQARAAVCGVRPCLLDTANYCLYRTQSARLHAAGRWDMKIIFFLTIFRNCRTLCAHWGLQIL